MGKVESIDQQTNRLYANGMIVCKGTDCLKRFTVKIDTSPFIFLYSGYTISLPLKTSAVNALNVMFDEGGRFLVFYFRVSTKHCTYLFIHLCMRAFIYSFLRMSAIYLFIVYIQYLLFIYLFIYLDVDTYLGIPRDL